MPPAEPSAAARDEEDLAFSVGADLCVGPAVVVAARRRNTGGTHRSPYISHYEAFQKGNCTIVNGEYGGLTGGMDGVQRKWYDPKKAPRQRLHTGWSHNREFPNETLPWEEDSWTPPHTGLDALNEMSKPFYENVHDVIRGKGKLIVTHEQVRRQVAVIEEAHRQNPLPKRAK